MKGLIVDDHFTDVSSDRQDQCRSIRSEQGDLRVRFDFPRAELCSEGQNR